MSALLKLAHRHAYLSRPEVAPASTGLATAFAAVAKPFQAPGMLGEGILQGVESELIYALLRHRPWVDAPLFSAVLIDHLAASFQLPRPVAQGLTRAMLPAVRPYMNKKSLIIAAGDQEFLRYICIATATAQDEASLLLDLGLGRRLLGRIKEALQLLLDDGDEDEAGVSRFIPELDAQITGVVGKLGHELRTAPWLLQQERLRYILAQCAEPWQAVLREQGVSWLFDLLLAIASRKTMNTRHIATQLRAAFPQEKGFVLDSSVATLCQELAHHHLLHLERGQNTWRALPLAEELTAEAYAMQALVGIIPEDQDFDLGELTGLNGSYQAAMIRALDLTTAKLESLILNLRPIAPLGLKAALIKLSELGAKNQLHSTLQILLANEPSAWLRRVAMELAASLGIAHEQGQMAISRPWQNDSTHTRPVSNV